MSPAVVWSETLSLKPSEFVASTCCLEPDEVLSITLTATNPVNAVLLDWLSFREWERKRRKIPTRCRFAIGVRAVKIDVDSAIPPYVVVLVISNSGRGEAKVRFKVNAQALGSALRSARPN